MAYTDVRSGGLCFRRRSAAPPPLLLSHFRRLTRLLEQSPIRHGSLACRRRIRFQKPIQIRHVDFLGSDRGSKFSSFDFDTSNANKQLDSKEEVATIREVNPSSELSVRNASLQGENSNREAHTFTYQELVDATDNFRPDSFLGQGGFGKVYKGILKETNQVVAIKQLDRNGLQGIREFVIEVLTLSLADHPNLVKLMGYCAEGEQKLLVYEFMPLGSLESQLLVL